MRHFNIGVSVVLVTFSWTGCQSANPKGACEYENSIGACYEIYLSEFGSTDLTRRLEDEFFPEDSACWENAETASFCSQECREIFDELRDQLRAVGKDC